VIADRAFVNELLVIRLLFVVVTTAVSFFVEPFQLNGPTAAIIGAVFSGTIVLLELRLRAVSLQRLIGASTGALVGILGALLISLVLSHSNAADSSSVRLLQTGALLLLAYLGMMVGAAKSDMLNLSAFGGLIGTGNARRGDGFTILDTSVIIDGRIADIAETGFLGGTLAVPQFVLRELQLVADSADSMKRNRGRRGLDILQRLQKMPQLKVHIMEEDFPNIRDVDMKLLELGKIFGCRIVTNDFNLNKVAQLHGVQILNINELANSLKPIVLPGETMRVFVLKEGKEYNQGVAYLDDGTMVVVDNARKMISKTIDISVTSVLQTTAGKMIFGRFDERSHAIYEKPHKSELPAATPAPTREPSATAVPPV